MRKKMYEAVPLAFGALLSVGVMTVFHACAAGEDGMWMNCHYVQLDIFYLGLAMTVLAAARLAVKQQRLKLILGLAGVALSVLAMLLPGTVMSMCMMSTMRCHALMKPFAMIMCAAYMISAAAGLFLEFKADRKEQTA